MIISGEVHYPRVPRELWVDRLKKLRRAGFNSVTLYFFWNFHELYPGVYDFSGQRDVGSLMEEIGKLGLSAIARVGPYDCAEWDNGGHPAWISSSGAELRSLDPGYFGPAERWLRAILSALSKYDAKNGGNVIGVQLENEYFWGNMPYHEALAKIARECGVKVDLYTNANRFARNTNFIDALDMYPDPWKLDSVVNQLKDIAVTQPSFAPKIMEYEGGWFSKITKPLPTERGSIPAKWTRMLFATALAYGSDLISFYMFHGGTNFARWTGRWMTTTYDYDAMVREWGELSDRYYEVKTVAKLAPLLEGSKLISEEKLDDGRLRIRRRAGEAVFTFSINNSDREWLEGDVRVPARDVRITVQDLPFGGMRVSSNLDLLGIYGGTLIFFGDEGEGFRVQVKGGKIVSTYGVEQQGASITGKVSGISGCLVEAQDRRRILVLSRKLAQRTWDFGFPVVSDAYYVEDADEREITAQLTGPSTLYLPLSLSDGIPELALGKISVDVSPSPQRVTVTGAKEAPLPTETMGHFDLPPSEEDLGIWRGSILSYSTSLPKRADYCAVVNDFAVSYDGELSSGYCLVEGKAGPGKLTLFADFTGRPNHPEWSFLPYKSGLVSPVLFGKKGTKKLEGWKHSYVDLGYRYQPGLATFNDYSKLLNEDLEKQLGAAKEWSDSLPEVKSPLLILYSKAEFESEGGPITLRIRGQRAPIAVILNGKRVYLGRGNEDFDTYVYGHAQAGLNTLVIASPTYSASGQVRPAFDDVEVTQWEGEAHGYDVGLLREGEQRELPRDLSFTLSSPSSISIAFDLSQDPTGDDVSPLYVELDGPFVAEVHLNGQMVGHYYDIGSQKRFYLPEPYLKQAGNELKLIALPTRESPQVKVSFGSYFSAKKVNMKLSE
ncbi:beta-galactosidase [Tardisphaera miroshnichenkoae]